jgi:sarcosine oxidase subunit beta
MWATSSQPPRLFQTLSALESVLDWARQPASDGSAPRELTHRGAQRLTRHLYGRQTRSGELIFGGDRQVVGYDHQPDQTGISINRGQAAEIVPLLRRLAIRRTWAGLMPFSLDGKPLIGQLPGHRALFILSGLASSGFGRGPMAGKLLAKYIHSSEQPSLLAEANPARCVAAL